MILQKDFFNQPILNKSKYIHILKLSFIKEFYSESHFEIVDVNLVKGELGIFDRVAISFFWY